MEMYNIISSRVSRCSMSRRYSASGTVFHVLYLSLMVLGLSYQIDNALRVS
jgi:hypothetical protein